MAALRQPSATASTVLDGLEFPECMRWHEGRLVFCDMAGDAVYAYDPIGDELRTVVEIEHPAGIGWLTDGRLLVVASEARQVLEVTDGGTNIYADLSNVSPGLLNDMLVDSNGRAFVGNFGFALFEEEPRPTKLIVVQPDGEVRVQSDDVLFPNGMATRSDGTLVVAETFGRRLTTFTIGDDGTLRRVSSLPLGDVVPDGICVDAEDQIWIASVHDNAVIRMGSDGETDRRQVSQMAFACVLGGDDGRTLFVATAPDYRPGANPPAGSGRVEAVRVEVPMADA
jgi:sugar lactone lactonase YvrE